MARYFIDKKTAYHEHLSSNVHVVHTTSKQLISCRGKNEKCPKLKNARAQRAKLLFFIIKYANL